MNCLAFGLISLLEGFSPVAYPDAGGWSIGYGTHGPHIQEGMVVSESTARRWACERIQEIEKLIDRTVPFRLSLTKRIALTSLIYNIGEGGWLKSRTLRELRKGNMRGALQGFHSWTKTQGQVSDVLVRRRQIEQRFAIGYRTTWSP
jgi:GH24 family phage-related lysozyme (muramidase)